MQTEIKSFVNEQGNMQLNLSALGTFSFRYPYLIDARKCVEMLQGLMRAQLLEDQLNNINSELKEYRN